MMHRQTAYNTLLALLTAFYVTSLPATASDDVDDLLTQLQTAPEPEAQRLANEVLERWSRSGSPAMDHLLRRGRDAMEAEDYVAALDHLTALTDHAPEFAEGWAARATLFFVTDRFGPAMADLERALALNPQHFGVLTAVAVILEQTDRPEAALRALEAALAIHPHMPNIDAAVQRLSAQTQGSTL